MLEREKKSIERLNKWFKYAKNDTIGKEILNVLKLVENLFEENITLKSDLYASNCIVNEQIEMLRNTINKQSVKDKIKEIKSSPDYNFVGAEWQESEVVSLLEELLEEE